MIFRHPQGPVQGRGGGAAGGAEAWHSQYTMHDQLQTGGADAKLPNHRGQYKGGKAERLAVLEHATPITPCMTSYKTEVLMPNYPTAGASTRAGRRSGWRG